MSTSTSSSTSKRSRSGSIKKTSSKKTSSSNKNKKVKVGSTSSSYKGRNISDDTPLIVLEKKKTPLDQVCEILQGQEIEDSRAYCDHIVKAWNSRFRAQKLANKKGEEYKGPKRKQVSIDHDDDDLTGFVCQHLKNPTSVPESAFQRGSLLTQSMDKFRLHCDVLAMKEMKVGQHVWIQYSGKKKRYGRVIEGKCIINGKAVKLHKLVELLPIGQKYGKVECQPIRVSNLNKYDHGDDENEKLDFKSEVKNITTYLTNEIIDQVCKEWCKDSWNLQWDVVGDDYHAEKKELVGCYNFGIKEIILPYIKNQYIKKNLMIEKKDEDELCSTIERMYEDNDELNSRLSGQDSACRAWHLIHSNSFIHHLIQSQTTQVRSQTSKAR